MLQVLFLNRRIEDQLSFTVTVSSKDDSKGTCPRMMSSWWFGKGLTNLNISRLVGERNLSFTVCHHLWGKPCCVGQLWFDFCGPKSHELWVKLTFHASIASDVRSRRYIDVTVALFTWLHGVRSRTNESSNGSWLVGAERAVTREQRLHPAQTGGAVTRSEDWK